MALSQDLASLVQRLRQICERLIWRQLRQRKICEERLALHGMFNLSSDLADK